MSHYLKSTVKLRSRRGLVAALRELGFFPTVTDAPTSLVGYRGDRRLEVADVIVPRAQLWAASNDVGFVELADGSFDALVSEFDRSMGVRDPRASAGPRDVNGPRMTVDAWLRRVAQLAGVHEDLILAGELGLEAERVDLDTGDIDVYVYAQN